MIDGHLLDEQARLGRIPVAAERLVNAIPDMAAILHKFFHVPDTQIEAPDFYGFFVQSDLEMVHGNVVLLGGDVLVLDRDKKEKAGHPRGERSPVGSMASPEAPRARVACDDGICTVVSWYRGGIESW
jgi:hypothetical protein